MNIDRRSGAPSTFTWLFGLALGGTCAAMLAACSASSNGNAGGWAAQSGGGPLGGETDNQSTTSTTTGDASVGSSTDQGGSDAGASGEAEPDASEGDAASDGASDAMSEGSVAEAGPDGEAGAATASFTLIDTAITGVIDGSPVTGFDPIAAGATIDLGKVGSALSIRANTIPAIVGSVGFALDATYTHTENTAPYMLCSDDGAGNITSCASVLTVGKHTLTATPYSAAALAGDAGAPITLAFTITDGTDAGGQ